jgi:hypothetical protein
MMFPDILEVESGCTFSSDGGVHRNKVCCNVAHKPDLRTTNYVPEFPPIRRLPSPLLSVTTTATVFAVVITTAAIYVTSAISAILNVAAVVVTNLLDQQDKLSLEGFFTHCRVQVL